MINRKIQSILMLSLALILSLISCNNIQKKETQIEGNKQGDEIVLKVAGYDLDRLKGIFTGKVLIENCKVEFHKVGIGDANTAAFGGANTYDITEIGLHPYMLAYAINRTVIYRDISLSL